MSKCADSSTNSSTEISSISRHRLWIDGSWQESNELASVINPFNSEKVAKVDQANSTQVDQSLESSALAFRGFRKMSRYIRSELLHEMARLISDRQNEFIHTIVIESGKPKSLATGEVSRAITTFTLASEEAKRLTGEVVGVDVEANGVNFLPAVAHLVPRGPVLAISPFNFPLNLVAHKVAPALAVGASVLLKPPPQAPGAAKLLAEVFESAALKVSKGKEKIPMGAFQVINSGVETFGPAVSDSRMAILSFTGSDKVGLFLQGKAVGKKVVLELGGNAAVIVHSDADLHRAAARCAFGAFAFAGQVCISIQRIFVQKSIFNEFQKIFLQEVNQLKIGNPQEADTLVGPMIDSGNVQRVLSWIEEAKQLGATVLCGGSAVGNILQPTVLIDVKESCQLNNKEVFGPTVNLNSYESFSDAVEMVNNSDFGLQAGVFTDSQKNVNYAVENLEVGGVVVNEAPIYRNDNLPYGGMKHSGIGREGVRYAMKEYCEFKTVMTYRI